MTKYNNRSGLGKIETLALSHLARNNKLVFTTKDLRPLCKNPAKLAHDLTRKKWLLRLRKGLYMITELSYGEKGSSVASLHSFVIASKLASPYYVGYWSALNYHGLTDQVPFSVFVASNKPVKEAHILGNKFEFVNLPKSKFFGLSPEKISGFDVLVSTKEKTIADCLDKPSLCGGLEEVAKALYYNHEKIDFKKLKEFVKLNNNQAAMKRLYFIVSELKLPYEEFFEEEKLSTGYSLLDPSTPRKGKHASKFKLVLNVKISPRTWNS